VKLGAFGADGASRTRRNTITRDDLLPMVVVTAVGALLAAASGCRPTGNVVGDVVCTGGIAAFTIWMAANASWWSLTLAGTLASIGAVGSLTGMALGRGRSWHRPVARRPSGQPARLALRQRGAHGAGAAAAHGQPRSSEHRR
jgi:hypothetical protein